MSIFSRGQRIRPGQWLVLPRDAKLPASTPQRIASRPPPRTPAPSTPPAVEANPEPPRDADLERARTLVERAVDDYQSARFAAALDHAGQAESALAGVGDHPDARKLSARAVFVTGSALAAQGENDRAKEAFARVHALDPGFEPPRGWLSPRLQELYAEARPDEDY